MDIRFSTFLVFVALLRKELRATITVGPSNTVASIGGKVKLNCTANMEIGYWYFSKNGSVADEVQILQVACTSVMPGFTDNYAMESIGGGTTCNLIVTNITMAQAGVYRCAEGNNQAFSILTVTDPNPFITDNRTTPVAKEGESVVFECVLKYKGSIAPAPTLRPYIYWTNSTGQNVTSFSDSTTNDTTISQLAVTAGRQNITRYTCHVYFILNQQTTPFCASNTPTVNSMAISSNIEVQYYPTITKTISTVSTTDNCVYKEETLTCTADANPPAEYEWLDLSNNNVTSGANKSISTGGQYQCIAVNVIRGQIYNDTKIENLTTCHSPYNLTIIGSNCNNISCSCSENQSPAVVTCMASGFPEPSYQWRSDVPRLENLGGNPNIEVAIDGNYSCTASNVYGSQTHSNTVSVLIFNCHYPGQVSLTSTVSSSMTMVLLASLLQYILN